MLTAMNMNIVSKSKLMLTLNDIQERCRILFKPLAEYVQINPIYQDKVGDILLPNSVSEGEKDLAETGYVVSIGDDVKYVKVNDEVLLDQFAIEVHYVKGHTIYLHKESRLKGIITDED